MAWLNILCVGIVIVGSMIVGTYCFLTVIEGLTVKWEKQMQWNIDHAYKGKQETPAMPVVNTYRNPFASGKVGRPIRKIDDMSGSFEIGGEN